jgi:hypothetical protein
VLLEGNGPSGRDFKGPMWTLHYYYYTLLTGEDAVTVHKICFACEKRGYIEVLLRTYPV